MHVKTNQCGFFKGEVKFATLTPCWSGKLGLSGSKSKNMQISVLPHFDANFKCE